MFFSSRVCAAQPDNVRRHFDVILHMLGKVHLAHKCHTHTYMHMHTHGHTTLVDKINARAFMDQVGMVAKNNVHDDFLFILYVTYYYYFLG